MRASKSALLKVFFSCRVSIDFSKDADKSVTFRMLSTVVSYELAKLGLEENFSVSELHQLWIKAKNGKIVTNIPLHKALTKKNTNGKAYLVRNAPSFFGIEVVLFDVNRIERDGSLDQILREVHNLLQKQKLQKK